MGIEVQPSGRLGVFGCLGYIIGIDGMRDDAAHELLTELHAWQTSERFWYRHEWEPQMLVMWDNRSVLHRATGGYEGFDRLLHRTTIGATAGDHGDAARRLRHAEASSEAVLR